MPCSIQDKLNQRAGRALVISFPIAQDNCFLRLKLLFKNRPFIYFVHSHLYGPDSACEDRWKRDSVFQARLAQSKKSVNALCRFLNAGSSSCASNVVLAKTTQNWIRAPQPLHAFSTVTYISRRVLGDETSWSKAGCYFDVANLLRQALLALKKGQRGIKRSRRHFKCPNCGSF